MQKTNKGPNGFPSPLVAPSIKESDQYGNEYGKSIENQWFNGKGEQQLYQKKRWDFQEYRAYRMGNQSTDRYKKYVNPSGDSAWVNLDFSPLAIIPKYVDQIKAYIVKRFFNVCATAIDPIASSEKDKERNLIAARMILKEIMQEMGSERGVAKLSKQFIPEDGEELEIYMSTNYKMAVEIALEQAIEFTFSINQFEEKVFKEVVDDLITLGIAGAKTELHPEKGIVTRYVDPINLVYSYTRSKFFDDIVYAGEVVYMTIAEVRERFNIDDEKVLKELAEYAQNKWGNGTITDFQNRYVGAYDRDVQNYRRYPYDSFKVQMLDFEFITTDKNVYEKKQTRFGSSTFTKKPDNYRSPQKSKFKRELFSDFSQCVYGGVKVVGKDMIFGYGRKSNQKRKKNSLQTTELSYKIVALNLKENFFTGYVQRMIPFADDMMRAHIKKQIVVAKMRPPGLIINLDVLDRVDLGDGELKPLELQDIMEQTGNLYIRTRDFSGDYDPSPPVRDNIANYVNLINQQILAYNHALQQLRDVIGFNEISDGSTPDSEQAVGVAQMAVTASNNAISHIADCAYNVVGRVADSVVTFIQDIIEYSPSMKKIYEEAIGKYDVQAISLMDRVPAHLFGINIEVDLSEDEKLELIRDIQIALQAGQIDISDKYKILSMRNIKSAGRYLAMRVRKNIARQQQEKMQSIQAQGQVNAQNQQEKTLGEIKKMEVEYNLKGQFETLQHQNKMKELALQVRGSVSEEVVRGQYDIAEERVREKGKRRETEYVQDRMDKRQREKSTAQSKIMKEQKSETPQAIDFTEEAEDSLTDILRSGAKEQ